jgi:hypothetical protein
MATRLGARFLSMTSLVPPAANDPFASSGTLAAGVVAPMARRVAPARFDVAEARARIADLAGGSFRPGSLSELMSYLAARFLHLEARRGANGQWTNYLVDLRSKGALLAAEVDRKLSTLGIAQMFGRTLDAEAEVTRRKLQSTPEMMDARVLRNELSSMFHRQGLVPDDDWESFDVTVSTTFGGRAAMVQGGEMWVGREVARAGSDPAENLRLMRRLQAQGHACLWPARNVEDARAGRLVHGMPIILREGAVRTRMIDPDRLSLQSLTRKFGESYYDYYDRKPRQPSATEGAVSEVAANVVPMSAFRRRAAAPAVVRVEEAAPAAVRQDQAGRHEADRYAIRHELDGKGAERLVVRDRWEDTRRLLGDTELPAGRYLKEDGFGMPAGSLLITVEGGYSHQDEAGRLHNTLGPAVVPAEGAPVYAIEGEILSAAEFDGRNSPMRSNILARRRPSQTGSAARAEATDSRAERDYDDMPRPSPAARPGR